LGFVLLLFFFNEDCGWELLSPFQCTQPRKRALSYPDQLEKATGVVCPKQLTSQLGSISPL